MRNRNQQLHSLLTNNKHLSNKGLTLVELLIALAINSILFAGLITIFMANISHYEETIKEQKLEQTLQAAMSIMEREIRRAGYWANAADDIGTGQNNNPFVATGADVSINAGNDCILFTYDHNADGILPAISNTIDDEHYGFRLSGQTLQTRPPGAAFDCTAASTAWENITDQNTVEITDLSFTLTSRNINTGPATKGITFRSIDISLTGQLTSDNSITKTLTQHIRIRNDKYIP